MNFKIRELGALLVAVGKVMILNNISAAHARCGKFDDQLIPHMQSEGIDAECAKALCEVELSVALISAEVEQPNVDGPQWEVFLQGSPILSENSEELDPEGEENDDDDNDDGEDGLYELCVIRKDNEHGHESWGWYGADKILIASDDYLSNPSPELWKILQSHAKDLAHKLNCQYNYPSEEKENDEGNNETVNK